MKLSEFFRLLGCGGRLAVAMARADRDALYRVEAEVNGIHAQVDARKAAR